MKAKGDPPDPGADTTPECSHDWHTTRPIKRAAYCPVCYEPSMLPVQQEGGFNPIAIAIIEDNPGDNLLGYVEACLFANKCVINGSESRKKTATHAVAAVRRWERHWNETPGPGPVIREFTALTLWLERNYPDVLKDWIAER